MAMGKRKRRAKQPSMWVETNDLPRSAAHPFYTRLNQILDKHEFDGYVEGLCQRFYADDGRPGLLSGRYFRLLLIGYFEGLDAKRAIAWRAADSFALREFLGLVLPEAPPDHSTISRPRRLIDENRHAFSAVKSAGALGFWSMLFSARKMKAQDATQPESDESDVSRYRRSSGAGGDGR